jgi:hypothetical protein
MRSPLPAEPILEYFDCRHPMPRWHENERYKALSASHKRALKRASHDGFISLQTADEILTYSGCSHLMSIWWPS